MNRTSRRLLIVKPPRVLAHSLMVAAGHNVGQGAIARQAHLELSIR